MESPDLQLTLIPAPDEPTPENLVELRREFEALPITGLFFEDFEEPPRIPPALSGSVVFRRKPLAKIIEVSPLELQLVAAMAAPLGAALGAWLHARYGRKVRLKIGEIEAEAQTSEEVQKLLDRALEIQQRNQPKVIHEP